MPSPRQHQRPPLVSAMEWVSQITTVSLEMSLPAAGGYWLDQKWGTTPWILIVGAVLGFYVAMKHLMALAKKSNRSAKPNPLERLDRSDESTQHREQNEPHE